MKFHLDFAEVMTHGRKSIFDVFTCLRKSVAESGLGLFEEIWD